MSQQYSWGSSSQQRRGLPPISTSQLPSHSSSINGSHHHNRLINSSGSPSRTIFAPTAVASSSLPPSSRQIESRASSISSTSSPFSPSQGAQQPTSSQLLSSSRARTIASSSNSQLASSTVATAQQAGVAPGSGGGGLRLARVSPSLSQSGEITSPQNTSTPSSTPFNSDPNRVASLVNAQISVLLTKVNQEKDKVKRETAEQQVVELVGQYGMDVFAKYFRRLLSQNAAQIFGSPTAASEAGSYNMLVTEVQKIRENSDQARKIACAIDTSEGEVYRDFDVSTFMERCKLDSVGKTMLALALKSASKPDLKTKADAILSQNLEHLFMTILNPTSETGEDLPAPYLSSLLDHLLTNPPRSWDHEKASNLNYAVRTRYDKMDLPVPSEILSTLQLADLMSSNNHLVRLVQRTGERATASLDSCKEMLASAEVRDINYNQVASTLLYMVISRNESYNPSIFVAALRDHRAGKRLDWQDVLHDFDRENFAISKPQFLALFQAFLPLAQEYENFDLQLLWGGQWQQSETQLSFVVAFLSCSTEELDATSIPRLRRAFTLDDFKDAADDVKDYAAQAVKHPLVSLDATSVLFHMIFQTQDTYKHAIALGIPETVINPHTDYFVLATAAVAQPWGGLQDQAFKQLFMPFLQKRLPRASFVFHGLWNHDSDWLATKLIETYNSDNTSLTYIFEHAQEHNWISTLTSVNLDFCIDLAALAHSHGVLDLDAWLLQAHQKTPDHFPRALSEFLNRKARSDLASQKDENIPTTTVKLSVKIVYRFVTFLQQHLPEEDLTTILRLCISAYPRLINYGEGFDEIIDANSAGGNGMSADADAAMQEHFKRLYNKESEVRDIVAGLREYKHSEDPAEQELFACMIAGLFDEYNCFAEYPDDALATTAVLFGSIINYDLLSRIALQAGLSMVLEALQTSTSREDKMYKFGVQALKDTTARLHEWPSFCERLIALPDLQGTAIWPIAHQVVNHKRSGEQTNGDSTNGIHADDVIEDVSAPFASLSYDQPLRADLYENPEEDTQDKVLFALNNVTHDNLTEKFQDLSNAIKDEHHQWFAKFLVEDRAKFQPNYHDLYLKILELFDNRWLWEEVIRETIVLVVRMLNADTTMTSTSERAHLKNLGGWLGSITVARDKPIKHRNIAFVDLLIEANKTNRLIAIIPFTCKVLSAAKGSKTFMPPNPWTLELLSVLFEFYHFVKMKINLKFEVEVLCKVLEFNMDTLEPSNIIRNSINVPFDDGFGNSITELEGFPDLSLATLNRQSALRGNLGDRFSPSAIANSLPDISSRLYYPPTSSNNMVTTDQTHQIFLQAALRAINEIIFPVVERSVTIAAIAASQLVSKDFATEPEESHYRTAAHSMVKSLAGSLALVTCREPLRMSMSNNVRSLARELPEESLAEGIILMFVNENIDIVCKVVEEAAEKQSIAIIEDHIVAGIHARQQHQMHNRDEPFQFPLVHKYANLMPDPYKPSMTADGLRSEQLLIYEGFGPSRTAANHATSASQDSRQPQLPDVIQSFEQSITNFPTPAEVPAVPKPTQPRLHPAGRIANGYSEPMAIGDMLAELRHLIDDAPEENIKELSPSSQIRAYYVKLVEYIGSLHPAARDRVAEACAQEVLNVIFMPSSSRLEIEIMIQLLWEFSRYSNPMAERIWSWLHAVEDERFLNSHITISLLNSRLIDTSRVDLFLANTLRQRNRTAILVFADLANSILLDDSSVAHRADFAQAIESLSQWIAEEPNLQIGLELLARLQSNTLANQATIGLSTKNDQIKHIFEEWIALLTAVGSGKPLIGFISQLNSNEFFQSEELRSTFVRTCLEASIAMFEEDVTYNGPSESAYLPVDALAKLIVLLVAYQGEPDGPVKPTIPALLESLLTFIALLQSHHFRKRGESANSKVFFRLYSSIMCEVQSSAVGGALAEFHDDIMIVFGKLFCAIQPAYLPGFSSSWVGLISHRIFMSSMIKMSAQDQGWQMYLRLFDILLTHTGTLIECRDAPEAAQRFYCAVSRIMLILHHDFQEFLTENHVQLCISISPNCSQLRNLILSAFPSSVPELPDPFTQGFKVDRLEDIRRDPLIRADIISPLNQAGVRVTVDNLLQTGSQSTEQIDTLCRALSSCKDIALIQSIVIYIVVKAIAAAGNTAPTFNKDAPHAQLLHALSRTLSPGARSELFGAMLNQLRYPNSHTHYVSYAILDIFGVPSNDPLTLQIQEQIARTLIERLVVFRPHPWGLLITIVELYKNPKYDFFQLPFVKAHEDAWNLPALQPVRSGGF